MMMCAKRRKSGPAEKKRAGFVLIKAEKEVCVKKKKVKGKQWMNELCWWIF